MGASASIPENLLSRGFSKDQLPPELRAILDFDKMPKNDDGEVLLKTLIAGLENKKDVFLSHEWGSDQGVHRFVSRFNKCLQERGARTWIDDAEMEGDINEKMSRGIDDSRVVIAFVTKGYIIKVNSDNANDNCKKEFNYAVNRETSAKMLLVVLDAEVGDTKKWDGPFGLSMGNQLYVSFFDHSEGALNAKADEILAANRSDRLEGRKLCN